MPIAVGLNRVNLIVGMRRLSLGITARHHLLNQALGAETADGKLIGDPTAIVVQVFIGDQMVEGWRIVHTRVNPPTVEYRVLGDRIRASQAVDDPHVITLMEAHGIEALGFAAELVKPAVKEVIAESTARLGADGGWIGPILAMPRDRRRLRSGKKRLF